MTLKPDQQTAGSYAFRVEDMTCGHCARTITKAIKGAWPDAEVEADPSTKLVRVVGVADATKLRDIVAAAGYTPDAALGPPV